MLMLFLLFIMLNSKNQLSFYELIKPEPKIQFINKHNIWAILQLTMMNNIILYQLTPPNYTDYCRNYLLFAKLYKEIHKIAQEN